MLSENSEKIPRKFNYLLGESIDKIAHVNMSEIVILDSDIIIVNVY
jgi:hypothetical protein